MTAAIIGGVGMTQFGKHLSRSMHDLASEAARLALRDAGATTSDVDMVVFSNAAAGLVTGQEMIRGQTSLRDMGLGGLPYLNIENACAGGGTAVGVAQMAIASGLADGVLVVGAEKLAHEDKTVSFRALAAAVDVTENASSGEADVSPSRSVFMDIYAEKTRKYMAESGATREDFADVTVKNRAAAALNPLAQFREGVTREEVLNSRLICEPLTLLMCSPIGDGAAAIYVCSAKRARQLGVRAVLLRAVGLASANDGGVAPSAVGRAADIAYAQAGIGPEDIDVAETHDASSPAEILSYEALRFCKPLQGAAYFRSGATKIGGRLSVNPSGGLVGRGHPVGATGVAQIVELAQQLRGQSGSRQRPNARVALAHVAGGQIADDAAAAAISILSL
ncbi:thiolase family protein [Bradyrhizobium sp. AUGA SZCCT0431]|uniref:thiolase family protein n=1 Tax=Bradyrhizobium sp. AUGA SZCCT0431 TaxID=2807674 RepID=UPI001BA7DEED|nr:thiolase family protein [Bradyrhizobium sp. AUGA SZCCT0431]MBR1146192.1 thiolase family protein [Bradyrhizobium sp. AUGA SZCCT0431]